MENEGLRRLKRIFGALLIGAAGLASSFVWAAGPKVTVNIPAGHAVNTLLEFYLQSRVQVLYLSQVVEGVQTQAVSGEFEASEALKRMLAGTGLEFEFESNYSAVVHKQTGADVKQADSAVTLPPVVGASNNQAQSAITPPSSGLTSGEEIVVTGSHIRGVLDIMSPLEIVTRKKMQQAAYATIHDAVQMLPANLIATQNEVFGGTSNYNRGTALNLRGLGAGATLVLVNGRRQPQAGAEADFVDVSNIPWSTVDRIEVLPDGTSALYGSDAIAGVVNIITRDNLAGAETQVRFGTAPDGGTETMAAQLLGKQWGNGKYLLAYQYADRTALAAADRSYSANSDKRSLGGGNYSSLRSNPGNILDPRTLQPVFAIPRNQNGTSLTVADLLPSATNWRNDFNDVQLLPQKKSHSLFVTASQDLSSDIELFIEGRITDRDFNYRPYFANGGSPIISVPASNPFYINPFGGSQPIVLAYDFSDDLGAFTGTGDIRSYNGTLGTRVAFGDSWQATLSHSHGEERLRWAGYGQINSAALNAALADSNPTTAFNPFGDGSNNNPATLAAISSVQKVHSRSTLSMTNIVADGPLFDLPTGTTKLAVGAEHRQENLDRQFSNAGQYEREVSAAFTELSIPLIGNPANARTPPRLELSLAARYETYSDFGDTFNPKLGLRWAPSESLKLRTNWGTSFKAPKLFDLYDSTQNVNVLVPLQDPLSPTKQSIVLARMGNNPNLDEERATTLTAGIDLAPSTIPGLSMSLTWYAIDYEDQVIQPGALSPFDILLNETQWAEVINRNPSQTEIDAICNGPGFVLPPAQCKATPPSLIVDIRKRNLAITQVEGLDLQLNRSTSAASGYFNFTLNGNYVFDFKRAFTKTSPVIEIVNTVNNPLALRIRGAAEWNQHGKNKPGLGASLNVSYANGYRDNESSIRRSVDAWTTIDFQLNYKTTEGNRWWNSVDYVLNSTNLFDQHPPFVDRIWGFDVFNAEPAGRVISLYIQKSW